MRINPALLHAVAGYLSHYPFDYKGWDLQYSDLERVTAFNRQLDRDIAANSVPAFSYLWLPNDHTAGLKAGFLTPAQLIAQNDRALGEIVEKISRTARSGLLAPFLSRKTTRKTAATTWMPIAPWAWS